MSENKEIEEIKEVLVDEVDKIEDFKCLTPPEVIEVVKVTKQRKPKIDMKAYLKEYYKNNKEDILQSHSKKEECKICNRMIRHQHMAPHMKTKICAKFAAVKPKSNDIDKIKQIIMALSEKLDILEKQSTIDQTLIELDLNKLYTGDLSTD